MASVNEHVLLAEEDEDESWSDVEFGGEEDEDESGSDMEFGEFDLSGARNLQDQQIVAGYEDEDDDNEDGCGARFSVRPYRGGALGREVGNLLLSGFEARSDGPELTEQHDLTSYDMRRLVHLALEGGGSMEDDEAYQRALAGGTPMSRESRSAMVGQALQSATQQQQQSKSPSQSFPNANWILMRAGVKTAEGSKSLENRRSISRNSSCEKSVGELQRCNESISST